MEQPDAGILVIDDDPVALAYYKTVLEAEGYENVTLEDKGRSIADDLQALRADLVLLDLNLPDVSGMEVLSDISRERPDVSVIVITADDSVDTAVECMRQGAVNFMTKPTDRGRVIAAVRNALAVKELRTEVSRLSAKFLTGNLEHPDAFDEIVTVSERMKSVFRYVEIVAAGNNVILITGESGTGKELLARAVHRLSRSDREFIAVNLAGLDDAVFSDTLFGHVAGAFTGADRNRKGLVEQAAGGTLFLDEIGDLDATSQTKLLRLLQEREYYQLGADAPKRSRARIVAATNADLQKKIDAGLFRTDLYYRLFAHTVAIPPLRDRPEDIPVLADVFAERAAREAAKTKPRLSVAAVRALTSYDFPGNVRELLAMITDAVECSGSGTLEPADFARFLQAGRQNPTAAGDGRIRAGGRGRADWTHIVSCFGGFPTVDEAIETLIAAALDRTHGNQSGAASILGLSQSTLSRRLRGSRDGDA